MPFTPLSDPLTPFSSYFVENDQRFVRRPTATARGLPYTPVPLFRGGAFRVALRSAFFGYK
eukprot:1177617-Heterocapsa_arctica.AAC.1